MQEHVIVFGAQEAEHTDETETFLESQMVGVRRRNDFGGRVAGLICSSLHMISNDKRDEALVSKGIIGTCIVQLISFLEHEHQPSWPIHLPPGSQRGHRPCHPSPRAGLASD